MKGADDFHASSNISRRLELADSFIAGRDYFREVSVEGEGSDFLSKGTQGGRVDRSTETFDKGGILF
jgi:hypothetical protein